MYENLSKELSLRMAEEKRTHTFRDVAFKDENAVRRVKNPHDEATVWRSAFVRDIDKIINCPYYSRYADKTQVFSFYKNDDVTRRSLHVQLVSRIARTIGGALNLNLDLIEAIALGHDIGHTPFGHAGERYLDAMLAQTTGVHFAHNLHSVRVLDGIFPYNISLQTLDGIAAHDGELELCEYKPTKLKDFGELDARIDACRRDPKKIKKLAPSTLEGCVVRISDIIAYLGKDRQDAERTGLIEESAFGESDIGSFNAEIINNLIVNIVENSYGADRIRMDERHFSALKQAKSANYALVYESDSARAMLEDTVRPMMERLFLRLVHDIERRDLTSPVFSQHIDYINRSHYRKTPYGFEKPEFIAADYIASMTDDYFVDLYAHLFPDSPLKITYRGYFD